MVGGVAAGGLGLLGDGREHLDREVVGLFRSQRRTDIDLRRQAAVELLEEVRSALVVADLNEQEADLRTTEFQGQLVHGVDRQRLVVGAAIREDHDDAVLRGPTDLLAGLFDGQVQRSRRAGLVLLERLTNGVGLDAVADDGVVREQDEGQTISVVARSLAGQAGDALGELFVARLVGEPIGRIVHRAALVENDDEVGIGHGSSRQRQNRSKPGHLVLSFTLV